MSRSIYVIIAESHNNPAVVYAVYSDLDRAEGRRWIAETIHRDYTFTVHKTKLED